MIINVSLLQVHVTLKTVKGTEVILLEHRATCSLSYFHTRLRLEKPSLGLFTPRCGADDIWLKDSAETRRDLCVFSISGLSASLFNRPGVEITWYDISPAGKSVSKSIMGEEGGCSVLAVLPPDWALSCGSVDSVLPSVRTFKVKPACTAFWASTSSQITGGTISDFISLLQELSWSVADTDKWRWAKFLLAISAFFQALTCTGNKTISRVLFHHNRRLWLDSCVLHFLVPWWYY